MSLNPEIDFQYLFCLASNILTHLSLDLVIPSCIILSAVKRIFLSVNSILMFK